jgi:hypothetical protein
MSIRELLGFQKGVPEQVDVHEGQPIDPTHLMINQWCCGNIEFGRYWFGVLPLYVGYLFETGYYKEPEASLTRDLPRI